MYNTDHRFPLQHPVKSMCLLWCHCKSSYWYWSSLFWINQDTASDCKSGSPELSHRNVPAPHCTGHLHCIETMVTISICYVPYNIDGCKCLHVSGESHHSKWLMRSREVSPHLCVIFLLKQYVCLEMFPFNDTPFAESCFLFHTFKAGGIHLSLGFDMLEYVAWRPLLGQISWYCAM